MDSFFDKIDDYLNTNLTSKDTTLFEEEMKKNSALEEEVKFRIIEEKIARLARENDIRQKVEKWRTNKTFENKTTNKSNDNKIKSLLFRKWRIVAASILALVSITYLILNNVKPSNAEIAQQYYVLPLEFSETRNIIAIKDTTPIEKGILAFQKQNLALAIQTFKGVQSSDSLYSKSVYLLCHTYYYNKKYYDALSCFNILLTNPIRKDDAEWYLSLISLQIDSTDVKIQNIRNRINRDQDHSYYSVFQELNKRVKLIDE